jgi:hypothetical protein
MLHIAGAETLTAIIALIMKILLILLDGQRSLMG